MKLNDDCIQLSYLTLLKSFKIVENDDNTFDQSMQCILKAKKSPKKKKFYDGY